MTMRFKTYRFLLIVAAVLVSSVAYSLENISDGPATRLNVYQVDVDSNFAYCASDSGMVIYNIYYPASPVFESYLNLSGVHTAIAAQGDYVYLTSGDIGLYAINVNKPNHPYVSDTYDSQGKADDIFTDGFFAFVADEEGGLDILNIAKPDSIYLVTNYSTPDCYYISVFVYYGRAYIVDANTGLRILDVADPLNPKPMGILNFSYIPKSIFVDDRFVFLANGGSGLEIIDARHAENPSFVCEFDTPGYACKAVEYDESVYVADGSGLVIIDISNPETPIITGTLELSGWAHDICVNGNYAYIAASDGGLQIVNIADDTNPILVGK